MSDFVAGLAGQGFTADLLQQAFAAPGFTPADLRGRAGGPPSFAATAAAHSAVGQPVERTAIDPVSAAHAAGYAEGLAAAADADQRDRTLTGDIAAALSGRVDRDRIARQLRQTVLFLVTKIVGEAGVAPDVLAGRVEAAIELLADAAESAMLRVHPDDVALLDGRLPETVFPVGDPAVARGAFVLESASTIVEDGPELWLDQLAAAIEQVAVPPAGHA